MGLGGVAIADPLTAMRLKVPFSDGLGGGGYCAANNPFDLLIQNLLRCLCKVSDCVAELTKNMRSCQNSWKNGQFSHFICRLNFSSVPLQRNQIYNIIK